MSTYLSTGYHQDRIALDEVFVKADGIAAKCSIPEYFVPADSLFHLTVPLAFVAVAQLAIVFAHLDNSLTQKVSEVFVHTIAMTCKRPVNKTEGIVVELVPTARRRLTQGVFYQGRIDVDQGSFVGKGTFLLPLAVQ
jgi:hypothetical protein